MAENSVVHDVEFVNNQIEIIKGKAKNYDNIAASLSKGIGDILGMKGAGEVCGSLSANKYSSQIDECKKATDFAIGQIRKVQLALIKYSKSEEDLNKFLSSVEADEWRQMGFTPEMIPNDMDTLQKMQNLSIADARQFIQTEMSENEDIMAPGNLKWYEALGGWAATGVASLFEGVAQFGETGVDLLILAGGGLAHITSGLWSDNPTNVWESTKALASQDWVTTWFDENVYSKEFIKKYAEENPNTYGATRAIGNGIGYSVALIWTGGAVGNLAPFAKAGNALQSVSGIGGKLLSPYNAKALGLIATAGVGGFSSGTTDAWAAGASTAAGFKQGIATGTWEAVQWTAGLGANKIAGTLHTAATSGIAKPFLSNAANIGVSAANVGFDMATGYAEGYVRPYISTLGTDITFKQAFDAAGGKENAWNQAKVAGLMSGVSEIRELKADWKTSATATPGGPTPGGPTPGGPTPASQTFSDAYKRKTEVIDKGTQSIRPDSNGNEIVTSIQEVIGPKRVDSSGQQIPAEIVRITTEVKQTSAVPGQAPVILETIKTMQKIDTNGHAIVGADPVKITETTILDSNGNPNGKKTVKWEGKDQDGNPHTTIKTVDVATNKTLDLKINNGEIKTIAETTTRQPKANTPGESEIIHTRKVTDSTGERQYKWKTDVKDGTGTPDAYNPNRSYKGDTRTSTEFSYSRKGQEAVSSKIEYNADGSVKGKTIDRTTMKGKKPVSTSKEVEYKTNQDGNGRKVVKEFGADPEDVTVKIRDAKADATFDSTGTKYNQQASHYRARDIVNKIIKGKTPTGEATSRRGIMDVLAERGGSKLATFGEAGNRTILSKKSGMDSQYKVGRDELIGRYAREKALAEGKLPTDPDVVKFATDKADTFLKKYPANNIEGVRNIHADAIARNLENRLTNPPGKIKNLALAAIDFTTDAAAISIMGKVLGGVKDTIDTIIGPSTTSPITTAPVETEPPTDPYIPPGDGPSGDDGGGGGPSEDTTPSDEITNPNDVMPNETPVSTTASPEQLETLPPEEEVITGITDKQPTTGGGNNWGQTGGGQSFDDTIPEDELTDEETLLGDENLDDLDTEDVYTIPMASDGSYSSVTKDGVNPVPILAGLGLVAAAGVGAKIYMDNKKNNENIDDDEFMDDSEFEEFSSTDSDLIADEWTDETLGEDMADTDADYERPSFYSDTLNEEI